MNVSLPWMPDHYAMIPKLVEKQLKTEKVFFIFIQLHFSKPAENRNSSAHGSGNVAAV